MLDFLISKSKVQAYEIKQVPIELFEIIGVGQVNPYCNSQYDSELFLTVVNIANETRNYDEKEGLVLTSKFTTRKCPKCKRVELIPIKMKINMDLIYKAHEEEIAFDAFEERPTRRHL